MKKQLLALFCCTPLLLFAEGQEACQCGCEQEVCECGEECACHCQYYRTSFQDSRIREDLDDSPAWSWPGRRDGELSDELSR